MIIEWQLFCAVATVRTNDIPLHPVINAWDYKTTKKKSSRIDPTKGTRPHYRAKIWDIRITTLKPKTHTCVVETEKKNRKTKHWNTESLNNTKYPFLVRYTRNAVQCSHENVMETCTEVGGWWWSVGFGGFFFYFSRLRRRRFNIEKSKIPLSFFCSSSLYPVTVSF